MLRCGSGGAMTTRSRPRLSNVTASGAKYRSRGRSKSDELFARILIQNQRGANKFAPRVYTDVNQQEQAMNELLVSTRRQFLKTSASAAAVAAAASTLVTPSNVHAAADETIK